MLEKRGYVVTVLEDGHQIGTVFDSVTFDIIFLDSETGGVRDRGLFAERGRERGRRFQNDLNIFLYIWQLIRNNLAINSRSVYNNKARHIRTKASALQISARRSRKSARSFLFLNIFRRSIPRIIT